MGIQWPPRKDQDLASYAEDMSAKLTATPVPFGVTAGDALALAGVKTSYVNALNVALDPATRTKSNIAAKNTAKAVLLTEIRSLGGRIRFNPSVTAAQLVLLAIPIHDVSPTPVAAPSTRPLLGVLGFALGEQVVSLADETTPTRRSHVPGVLGAQMYSAVTTAGAPTPSTEDLEQWEHKGFTTKSEFAVSYDAADNGKTGHVMAVWMNRKGATGPASVPVSAPIAA